MSQKPDLILTGASGTTYRFEAYTPDHRFDRFGAVYAFINSPIILGPQIVAYVGKANDFADRFSSHERWSEAVRRHGVNTVARLLLHSELQRVEIERDLIHAYSPPLNTQHKVVAALIGSEPTKRSEYRTDGNMLGDLFR